MIFRSRDKKNLNHVALSIDGTLVYATKKNIGVLEAYRDGYRNIKTCIRTCIQEDIPILTFNILPDSMKESNHYSEIMDALAEIFDKLGAWDLVYQNQVKISVFGKWYDLPERVVEPIKKTVSNTKDYDRFFVNFCVNYNGQEEIVDACKILIRQAMAGKINLDQVNSEMIKDNLYSSYFMPPDIIIKTGKVQKLKGFLLWDSVESKVVFVNKYWPEFTRQDLLKSMSNI